MSVVALAAKDFHTAEAAAAPAAVQLLAPKTTTPSSSSSSPSSSSSSNQFQDQAEEERPSSYIEEQDQAAEEDCEEDGEEDACVDLGPIIPLKQQLELDKEDESLRRWKEQLLGMMGSLHLDDESLEPQVKVLTLGISAEGRQPMIISLPLINNSNSNSSSNSSGSRSKSKASVLFTLKEGSCYRLCFTFSVKNNIVSGLTYFNTVWKSGLRVDHTRTMLGTYAPQSDPYTHFTDEEITPSGILARGCYSRLSRS